VIEPRRNGRDEYQAMLLRRMQRLASRYADLPDNERRALLARARREMIEQPRPQQVKP
jgi:hypothetical protein